MRTQLYPFLPARMPRPGFGPLAALAATITILASGAASAQVINNPPRMPQSVIVFSERDFTSISGFTPNADLSVQLIRKDASGTDQVVGDAAGRTNDAGLVEVNHLGGVCWNTVTPDIVAADTVRVTYRDTAANRTLVPTLIGSGAATTTQNVTAKKAVQARDALGNPTGTVVITGRALQGDGTPSPISQIEVRILNPGFISPPGSRIGKRDIRADSAGGRIDDAAGNPIAGTSGTLAYDALNADRSNIGAFTAVFAGLNDFERQLVVEGETRVMGWQQTTAAGDRLGLTIYEVGQLGGPGFGGCPPGPNGVVASSSPNAPVHYDPTTLWNAARTSDQSFLKNVIVFPERDFVSIDGFAPDTELQVVVRRGTSGTPVVGTARGVVGRSGLFEVNHVGGVCWSGQTPNIGPDDWIDVMPVSAGGAALGQTQRVINARVTKRAYISGGGGSTSVAKILVDGSALDENGAALPLGFMEQRIINPDFVATRIGRRDIMADIKGGRVGQTVSIGTGNLLRTTGSGWQAVYTGLNATEQKVATAGESRAMAWQSTNGNGDRFGLTIYEFGQISGPGFAGCPATGSASIAIP